METDLDAGVFYLHEQGRRGVVRFFRMDPSSLRKRIVDRLSLRAIGEILISFSSDFNVAVIIIFGQLKGVYEK